MLQSFALDNIHSHNVKILKAIKNTSDTNVIFSYPRAQSDLDAYYSP